MDDAKIVPVGFRRGENRGNGRGPHGDGTKTVGRIILEGSGTMMQAA